MSSIKNNLEDQNIAVVGLGLMGGSLAMALHGQCKSISGLDTDSESVRYAEKKGIVDRASTMPDEILSEATVIILACPVTQILKWIEELPSFFSQLCVVLDLGSTKAQIISKMDKMPQNFDPLGGHPICGKEKLSIKNSEKGLFTDAPFVLVRSKNTTTKGEGIANEIIDVIGAEPIWMEADDHDRALAATSHLPFLVASSLALGLEKANEALTGPGLRSTTRLAATPASMMLDVLTTNRENILEKVRQFRSNLDLLSSALEAGDDNALTELLTSATSNRNSLIS